MLNQFAVTGKQWSIETLDQLLRDSPLQHVPVPFKQSTEHFYVQWLLDPDKSVQERFKNILQDPVYY